MAEKKGLFGRIREGLTKTRDQLMGKIEQLVSYHKNMDDDFFDDLEEALISSDLGVTTAMRLVEEVRDRVRREKIGDTSEVYRLVREAMAGLLQDVGAPDLPNGSIVLMVGVNGVGKTTTAGKLAAALKAEGKSVLLAAADTFRAAACEQLQIWGQRADVPVIHHQEGADPAAVVFDAIAAQKARGVDVLVCDTAGRLHNKKNLMNELEKIQRVTEREAPQAHKEVLLVLDATTGQNAVAQAKTFAEACHITGIVLTKLDGTAKGGVVISIAADLGVPVRYIGVGEGLDDLQPFDPEAFVAGIL